MATSTFAGRQLSTTSEFRIDKSDDETIVFQGERIVHVSHTAADRGKSDPQYDTAVYKTADGKYVVALRFNLPLPTEKCQQDVETVDTLQELDDFLCLQDPESSLDQESLQDLTSAARTALVDSVTRPYYRHVTEVLEAVREWECGVSSGSAPDCA